MSNSPIVGTRSPTLSTPPAQVSRPNANHLFSLFFSPLLFSREFCLSLRRILNFLIPPTSCFFTLLSLISFSFFSLLFLCFHVLYFKYSRFLWVSMCFLLQFVLIWAVSFSFSLIFFCLFFFSFNSSKSFIHSVKFLSFYPSVYHSGFHSRVNSFIIFLFFLSLNTLIASLVVLWFCFFLSPVHSFTNSFFLIRFLFHSVSFR